MHDAGRMKYDQARSEIKTLKSTLFKLFDKIYFNIHPSAEFLNDLNSNFEIYNEEFLNTHYSSNFCDKIKKIVNIIRTNREAFRFYVSILLKEIEGEIKCSEKIDTFLEFTVHYMFLDLLDANKYVSAIQRIYDIVDTEINEVKTLEQLEDFCHVCCSYNIPHTPGKGVYKPENFVKFFPKAYVLPPVIIFVKLGFKKLFN